jgi:hypothetical protein
VTRPRTVTSRGNRRPSVKVERDKLVAAEGVVAGKTSTEIAAELGVAPSTVRRLASQGLREAMESGERPTVEKLFNLVVSSFTEVMEKLDETIAAYETSGKLVPTRTLMAKIYAAQAIAKTCGFDSKTFVVSETKLQRPTINIILQDDDGEKRSVPFDQFGTKPLEEHRKQLNAAPITDAEVAEAEINFRVVKRREYESPVVDAEVVEPE